MSRLAFLLVLTLAPALCFAASPFDGNYNGTRTVTSGTCGAPSAKAFFLVKDGWVYLRPRPRAVFKLQIAPDGRFSGAATLQTPPRSETLASETLGVNYQGQIVGNRLEIDQQWAACTVHFSAEKSPFDGVYQGTATLTRGSCLFNHEARLVIRNGLLVFRPGPITLAKIPIAPDGHFSDHVTVATNSHANVAGVTYVGRFQGNRLEYDVVWDTCTVHLSLVKTG